MDVLTFFLFFIYFKNSHMPPRGADQRSTTIRFLLLFLPLIYPTMANLEVVPPQ